MKNNDSVAKKVRLNSLVSTILKGIPSLQNFFFIFTHYVHISILSLIPKFQNIKMKINEVTLHRK